MVQDTNAKNDIRTFFEHKGRLAHILVTNQAVQRSGGGCFYTPFDVELNEVDQVWQTQSFFEKLFDRGNVHIKSKNCMWQFSCSKADACQISHKLSKAKASLLSKQQKGAANGATKSVAKIVRAIFLLYFIVCPCRYLDVVFCVYFFINSD